MKFVLVSKSELCFVLKSDISTFKQTPGPSMDDNSPGNLPCSIHTAHLWRSRLIHTSWYHILSSPLKERNPKTPSLKPYHDNASFTHMYISILLVHQNKPPIIRPSSRSVDHSPPFLLSTNHLTYRCPPLFLYLKLSFCSLTIKCNSVSKKL